jgi:hypothetical protein
MLASPAAITFSIANDFYQAVEKMLPLARMQRERGSLRASYLASKPYPHVVVDGFFDEDVLDQTVADFPRREERDWNTWATVSERKQTSRGITQLSPFTQMFFLQLCSEPFLEHLRYITGFPDLVMDPLFHGGGLHESARGGWLNVHADWTKHPSLPLTRQLNLLIYLNREWDPSWRGDLELYDYTTKECGARILPVFNRAVLFPTTRETLHGFPTPVACPANRTRKSISVYYWSPDPEALKTSASSSFLPGRKSTRMRALAHYLIPPIVFEARDILARHGKRR